jgi:hypothetical protein
MQEMPPGHYEEDGESHASGKDDLMWRTLGLDPRPAAFIPADTLRVDGTPSSVRVILVIFWTHLVRAEPSL